MRVFNKMFVILALLTLGVSIAQHSSHQTALPLLLLSTDARSGGLANNGVATSSDAYSVFHNPSKVVFGESNQLVSFSFSPWLRGIAKDVFLGELSFIKKNREESAWGASLKYFSLGKVDFRTLEGKDIGVGNPNEMVLTGMYTLKLYDNFAMAVALKYIHSNLKVPNSDVESLHSVAVDISGFYSSKLYKHNRFNNLYRFGFNLFNLGPKVSYRQGASDFLPFNLKMGGGLRFILDKTNSFDVGLEVSKLLVPNDIDTSNDFIKGAFASLSDNRGEIRELVWGLSAEYNYAKKISLRTGYFYENIYNGGRKFITTGVGFKRSNMKFDISYLINTTSISSPLSNSMRFSLSYDFTNSPKKVRKVEELNPEG